METISYQNDKAQFLSLLEGAPFPVPTKDQFVLQSEYNSYYFDSGFRDLSFILVSKNQVKSVVPCHVLNGKLCMNGFGIIAYYDRGEKKTIKAVYDALLSLADSNNVSEVLIRDADSGREIGLWGYEAYKYGARPKSILTAEINLLLPDTEIHSGVRDSYRSLINQARRELEIRCISAANIEPDIFRQFYEFHIAVAGRETRSKESWNTQFKMIEAGCAELIVGYMEPYGLVSSALFTDYAKTTSYAVAVYNRDLFDKPLAHALVYEAIFRAKVRNQENFYLGILPHESEVSAKEFSISQFKKGFCARPLHCIEWCLATGRS